MLLSLLPQPPQPRSLLPAPTQQPPQKKKKKKEKKTARPQWVVDVFPQKSGGIPSRQSESDAEQRRGRPEVVS